MDEVGWGGLLRQSVDDGGGGTGVVCVGCVDDDVCFGGFGGEEFGAVEVAVDELDLGVLGGDFGAFVGVADEGCDVEVRVRVGNGVEDVTTDVARGSCATTD